jgi:DNA-binding MarR family transcriptional regulator
MAEKQYEALKLENQLCFPLYACAREVVKKYKPFLDDIDLTYTQYVTMMVLWEKPSVTSKEIGERLHLDSGTLTPVIKKLAEKGLVTRARAPEDERNLVVALTDAGLALRDRAASIPGQMAGCVRLDPEDARTLYRILYQLLGGISN